MRNTKFYEMRLRYWEYLRDNKAPKGNYREGIMFYMDLFMYSIGLDPNNPSQEYVNKYMDTLDTFDSMVLPKDEIEAGKVIDQLLLDCFDINPSWNDLF